MTLLLGPITAVFYLALPTVAPGGAHLRLTRADAAAAVGTGACREQPRRVEIDGKTVEAFAVVCEDSRAPAEAPASAVAAGLGVDEPPRTASEPSAQARPQLASDDPGRQRRSATKPRRARHAARPRAAEWGTVASHQKFGP